MAERHEHVIDAPGEVTLALHPAGIGSRFVAALLDHMILLGLLMMFVFAGLADFKTANLSWLTLLLVYAGWFTGFEILTGRTPGKAAVGLSVIRENGDALDVRGALVRNIVRLAYVIPVLYVLEILLVALDSRSRRLGDALAGTLVIGERRSFDPGDLFLRVPRRDRPHHHLDVLDKAMPTADEYRALRTFCFRTRTLDRRSRDALARRLLAPLYRRAGLELPDPAEQEELLVDLVHYVNGTFDEAVDAPAVS